MPVASDSVEFQNIFVSPRSGEMEIAMNSNQTLVSSPSAHRSRSKWAWATEVRQKARWVLNGGGGRGVHLTLVLGVMVFLTLSVGVYALSEGAYMVGYLLAEIGRAHV